MMARGNQFRQGDFVRHPKMHAWGVGVITEDQRGDSVKVFFEEENAVKTMSLNHVQLLRVEDPGESRTYLENALVDEEALSKGDRQPFPVVLKKFLEDFPGGFSGEIINRHEVDYKAKAHLWMLEHLDEDKWRLLADSGKHEELSKEVKRLFSKTDLVAPFELMDLNDAFKNHEVGKQVISAFYDLLYGRDSFKQRFEAAAKVLSRHELAKWPIITYPLFIRYPEKYMFVKPKMTQKAALNRGFDIQYSAHVNWNTYNQVQLFSKDLFDRLTESENDALHPRDMIDLQSFMWCTYGKGWSAEDVAAAKRDIRKD